MARGKWHIPRHAGDDAARPRPAAEQVHAGDDAVNLRAAAEQVHAGDDAVSLRAAADPDSPPPYHIRAMTHSDPTHDTPAPRRWATVPNAICVVRLLGSPLLPVFAWMNRPGVVVGLLIAGLLGDWIDGKIARRLNQRSAFGPLLDTLADVVMYTALAGAIIILRGPFVLDHLPWFGVIGVTYAISVLISVARFGRWPTYHTRAAKVCWLLVGLAAIVLLLNGPNWPFYPAAVGVILTNLEAIALTCLLDQPRTDIESVFTAPRRGPLQRDAPEPPDVPSDEKSASSSDST